MHYKSPVLPDNGVQIYVVGHHFTTKVIPKALMETLLLVRSVSDPEQSSIGSFFYFSGRDSSINHLESVTFPSNYINV